MTRRRRAEQVAFAADDPSRVVASMARLAEAGDGWINLLPVLPGSDDEQPTSLRFSTLFNGGAMGVTMATWIAPGRARAGREQPRLGITHVTGHKVVPELAARSVPVPASWVVEQDHRRRGLVVRLPADEPHEAVLAWALRALAALSAPTVVQRWRADVHVAVAS